MNSYKKTVIFYFAIFIPLGEAKDLPSADDVGATEAATVVNPVSEWKSEAELGVVSTSGNTNTSSVSARLDVTNDREKWRHNIHLEGYRSKSEGLVSAEKYQLSEKSDYKFNPHDYVFFRSDYEDDKFREFKYKSFSTGYGHRFLKGGNKTLDLELGPGIRISQENSLPVERENFLRMASKFVWELSASSRFMQEINVDRGEDLTISKSITALQVNVNKSLAMKLTHTIRHKSMVLPGLSSTDRETATTLVYLF